MKVIVTGSHGLVGRNLVKALRDDGHQATTLVRGSASPAGPDEVFWDPPAGVLATDPLEGHDAVVHLAGVGIGEKRWTAAHKAAVLDSRLQGTTLLSTTLLKLKAPPRVMVSASAIGYYGDRGDEELVETSGPGEGFLSGVVQQWEASTAAAESAGIRVAHIRSSVILSAEAGALKEMSPAFKLGIGGRFGSGNQWMSWISIDDEIRAIRYIIDNESLRGPANLTAPGVVTNRQFARTLGRVLNRPAVVPAPVFALGALYGRQMMREMILYSQRGKPAALLAAGFEFQYPELEGALRHVLGRHAA